MSYGKIKPKIFWFDFSEALANGGNRIDNTVPSRLGNRTEGVTISGKALNESMRRPYTLAVKLGGESASRSLWEQ